MSNVNVTEVGGNAIRNTVIHGQKDVTTAGTEVVLGTAAPISAVTIKAKSANTGLIFVGANPVTSSTGYILAAGEAVLVMTDNVANIYIDSSVNGEGVSFVGS